MRGRTKIAILLALAGLIAGVTPVLASSSGQGLEADHRLHREDRESGTERHRGWTRDLVRHPSGQPGGRERRPWHEGSGRSRVVRLPHAQAPCRPDSGADQGAAPGSGRLVQVVLGCERDRGHRPTALWSIPLPRGPTSRSSSRTPSRTGSRQTRRRWLSSPSTRSRRSRSRGRPSRTTIEPGINQVKAPNVWALGFNGTGIVIANQDTGIRWTHNALKPHYRGWNGERADHNYDWWDAIHSGGGICGPNTQEPCDDNSHGTHTTGTTSVTTAVPA